MEKCYFICFSYKMDGHKLEGNVVYDLDGFVGKNGTEKISCNEDIEYIEEDIKILYSAHGITDVKIINMIDVKIKEYGENCSLLVVFNAIVASKLIRDTMVITLEDTDRIQTSDDIGWLEGMVRAHYSHIEGNVQQVSISNIVKL